MKLAYDLYSPATTGDQGKSPVILLHGRLDSRKTWKKFAQEIANKTGRMVYAYDARNHGESPWSDEMDFEVLTNDLEQFMNDQCISKAVLVGHSMGGKTAILFALSKPEKVEKLFVEDMVVENYSPSVKNSVSQAITLLRMSLKAIPAGADELTAKKAVYDFVTSFFQPGKYRGFMFEADTLPLKQTENGYAWQSNLDVLEEMLKNRSSYTLSGTYHGPALFLYGSESFFEVDRISSRPLSMSAKDAEEPLPAKSVSASTRIAGSDVKTVYTFGPGTEFIEIFVAGELRAKIVKDLLQDVYCNLMKHDDLPSNVDLCASTAIVANDCVITTEVIRRGRRESIAVYKDNVLLCRTGNTVLED